MTLPPESSDRLISGFEQGKDGIMQLRHSMTTVDSSSARVSDPSDEAKVKKMIMDSVGFEEVDLAIRHVMIAWVASELRNHMVDLVQSDNPYTEEVQLGYRESMLEEFFV